MVACVDWCNNLGPFFPHLPHTHTHTHTHTVTVSSGDTVAGATNVPAPSPPSHIPPPSSPSHVTPPSSHLSLQGDVRVRSSSMNHLDKSHTRRVVERDRMLDALNIFSWLLSQSTLLSLCQLYTLPLEPSHLTTFTSALSFKPLSQFYLLTQWRCSPF